jgi:hypothetical protein
MSRIVAPNGQNPKGELVVRSFQIAMMVTCPCGTPLLLSFIPGMALGTTCKCKRVITLRGVELDPNTQALGTAIIVDDTAILTPSDGELVQFSKVQ